MNLLETLSAFALCGLLADPEDLGPSERKEGETCEEATARLAVRHAKALIEELEKEQ